MRTTDVAGLIDLERERVRVERRQPRRPSTSGAVPRTRHSCQWASVRRSDRARATRRASRFGFHPRRVVEGRRQRATNEIAPASSHR